MTSVLERVTQVDSYLSKKGFKLVKELGRGASGTVALFERNGQRYAIKIIDINQLVENEQMHHQQETGLEMSRSKALQIINKESKNIAKINQRLQICGDAQAFILQYESFIDPQIPLYYLVSEPMSADLYGFFLGNDGCLKPDCPQAIIPGLAQNRDELIVAIICQLFYALRCLHQIGLVHGDLKPENIFIDGQTGQIKIADFGGSGWMRSDFEKVNQRIDARTPIFSAPEVIQDPSLVTGKSDVWSLGVTILALIIKYPKVIYKYSLSDKPQAMIDEIIEQQVNMKDKAIEKWLKELLKNMLIKDPRTRQGLHQIVNETNRKCKVPVEKILSAKSKDEDDDYIILNLPKDIEQIIREFLILW